MSSNRDPYEVLQVLPSAVPEVIEAAYRALAMLHHPDLSGHPGAESRMAELNWAYGTLRNHELRAAYDRQRIAIPVKRAGSLSQRVQDAAAGNGSPDSAVPNVVDFGRYAGKTLAEIARIEPAYLEWLRRHSSGLRYRHQIDELLHNLAAKRA